MANTRNGRLSGGLAPSRICVAAGVALALSPVAFTPGALAADVRPVTAQAEQPMPFAIPAQPLEDALNAFIAATDWQVGFPAALTKDVRSSGVSGSYTAEQALEKLLQGTGVSYRLTGNRTVTLEKPATVRPEDGARLGKVTVTARSADPEKPYQASVSTAGSKFPVEITRIPQSIQVVTAQAIKDQGALTVGNILKNIPSANVGQTRFSRFPKFYIRGFKVIQQRNGFRQLFMSDTDFSALSNIDSFEVLKGPGSSQYGQGAQGGMINIVTKRPKDHFAGFITGIGGSFDQKGVQFDATGPLTADGALKGRLTGELERSGSFIDHQGIDRDNLALALSWDNGGPVRGFLNMEYQERESKPNPGLPALGTVLSNGVQQISRTTYLGEPKFDRLIVDSPLVQAWLDIDVAKDWVLSPRFQYTEFNSYQNQVFLGAAKPDKITFNRFGRMNFRENDRTYTAQLDLKGKFDTGPFKHQVLIGGEYEDWASKGSFINFASVPAINVLGPTYLSAPPALAKKPSRFSAASGIGSFYFQDLMAVTDRFDLFGGVRQTSVVGTRHAINGKVTHTDLDQTTFNIGGSYHVAKPVTLFAGYAKGFDVESQLGTQSFTGRQFLPEQSEQVEGGLKLDLAAGLTGTFSLFDITRTNVTTPDRANPGFSVQTGEVRSRGAEFDLGYQITDQWFVQGGYAYLDARILKSNNAKEVGKRPWDVAEHQANLWTRYKFDSGLLKDLSVGAGANFVGKRPGDNANTFDLPAYSTVDLSASYQWKNVRAELFALNVLDKRYFTSADFGATVFAGNPRQLYGRLTFEF